MTKPIPGIKIPYFLAEQYPDEVEGFRCVQIHIPDDPLFMALLGGLLKLPARSFNWRGGTYERRLAMATLWRDAYDHNDWESCMNCEDLIECLQPLFDSLESQISDLQQQLTDINDNISRNGAKQIELPPEPAGDAVYAGALALVQAMDRKNRELYAEAEASSVDNTAEWIGQILDLFPNFSAQGVGAGADLANAYFENQVATYEAEYPEFEVPAACNLKCWIDANDGVFDIDVWGNWLNEIDILIPDNAPAKVYAKYSPLRQTFLNQIAELINGEQSLKSYFDELFNIYFTGTQTPVAVPPECNCDYPFCRFSDFDDTLEDDNWEPVTGLPGIQAILLPQGYCPTSEVPPRITIAREVVSVATINTVTVVLSEGFEGGIGAGANTVNLYDETGLVETLPVTALETVYEFTTPISADFVVIDVVYDADAYDGRAVPSAILSITVEGEGAINPFGETNCEE